MANKTFFTYDEQIEKLEKEKQLVISDPDFAKTTLQKLGYFSLIGGYKDLFKHKPSGNYLHGVTFEKITAFYYFDEELRTLFLKYILHVERQLKSIYREYLEGSRMDKIADGLMADGILTGAGKTKWHTSTINKILRNEKYMGDALLQKTYTTDFLTKKRIKNNGTVPQYYVEGDHEAIIPKELFIQVQAELVRRRVVHGSPTGKKRSFSCNHCFAQMVFCGDFGELYRRVHWNNHGCKSIVWRCISRLEPTSAEKDCTNRTVNELLLQEVTVKTFHQILTERDFFLKTLQQNIAKAVVNADTLSPDGIQARLEELQKELIKKATNKQDYDAIADEIFRLRDQKEQSELDSHHREEAMNRIKELQDFISGQESDITEFDEALVKKLIEKITVFADHFTMEFKSGITIDIEA